MSKKRSSRNQRTLETAKKFAQEIQASNNGLTESEVYDVLKFAGSYYQTITGDSLNFSSFGIQGVYTPQLTNERLAEIGLNANPLTDNQLRASIDNPIIDSDRLTGFSEYLQITDMIAKRTSKYLGNLPAFDYSFVCTNIKDESEYESAEYLRDRQVVKDFLTKFDVKSQFAFVHRRTMDIETFYGVLRTDGNNFEFQELPYNYCKITGKNLDWGYQFDFDMSWFLRMGLSIDQYPKIFKKMQNKVMKGKDGKKYDPSNALNERNGTYALWCQTSSLPKDGNFVCFKMNSDVYANIPYLAPMFQDAVNRPIIRALQNNQYIIASQKILIGLIPLLKEQKSGQVKDALAVSPETMGKFLGLFKRGLSDAIKISGAPFTDVKQLEFELPAKNMYNESNSVEASSSGATSSLVYKSGDLSATEVKLSSEIDTMIATSVYPQYAKWLSTMINSLTTKYKFKFKFKGNNFSDNKKTRLENALKLADKGIIDFQEIASACGDNIFEFEEKITSSSYSPLWKKLRLLPNANTKDMGSTESGNVGRPMTDTPAESTERNLDRDIIGG